MTIHNKTSIDKSTPPPTLFPTLGFLIRAVYIHVGLEAKLSIELGANNLLKD